MSLLSNQIPASDMTGWGTYYYTVEDCLVCVMFILSQMPVSKNGQAACRIWKGTRTGKTSTVLYELTVERRNIPLSFKSPLEVLLLQM